MSFNFEKVGRQIATVIDGNMKGKIVSVAKQGEEKRIAHKYENIELEGDNMFQQIPAIIKNDKGKEQREIIYVCGPSGSGKSTYTRKYCEQYKKKHKDAEIFLISPFEEDESLDAINPTRLPLTDKVFNPDDPLTAEDFEDSLVIFDDIDNIDDDKIRAAVNKLLGHILQLGRHHNVYCVMTNHVPAEGIKTRKILNECHSITFFPHAGGGQNLERLMKVYLSLTDDDIDYIFDSGTWWATVFKHAPMCLMTEKALRLLKPRFGSRRKKDSD